MEAEIVPDGPRGGTGVALPPEPWTSPNWNWGSARGDAHDAARVVRGVLNESPSRRRDWITAMVQSTPSDDAVPWEEVKLVMALAFYLRYDGDAAQLVREVRGSTDLLLQYIVPALLYCVYNNLVYLNLTFFDPGTYNVLMQLRIVITGLVYQRLFSKRLNRNQWCAPRARLHVPPMRARVPYI